MQIPIIPYRGQRKPYGSIPRINWGHPLTVGLLFYHYDLAGGGVDLVGGRAWSLITANKLSVKPSRWGTGHVIPSSTSDGYQYAASPNLRIVSPMSWAAGFYRTVAATEASAVFFGRAANSGGSAPAFNWGITDFNRAVSNSVGGEVNSGGAFTDSGTGVTLALNAFHTVVCSSAATSSYLLYADGVVGVNTTGLTIQSVNTGDNIFVGTDTGGPGGFQGQVFWGGFWNRALTAQEARTLHDDPYCFLIYPEDEMFAALVGVNAAAVSLTGNIAIQLKLAAATAGAAALSAKTSIQLKQRATITVLQQLTAKTVIQLKAAANSSLTALLSSRTAIQLKANANALGALALQAKTAIQSKASALEQGATSLTAKTAIQLKAAANIVSGVILVAGTSKIMMTARANASGVLSLAARTAVQVKSSAVASVTGAAVALTAATAIQLKAMAQSTQNALLTAKNTIMLKSAAAPTNNIFMQATSNIQTKARAAFSSILMPLTAKTAIQIKSAAQGLFTMPLQAKSVIQTKARATLTQVIFLTSTSAIQVKAAATGIFTTALSGSINIAVQLRSFLGTGPLGQGVDRIVKFIGNVGHFLVR